MKTPFSFSIFGFLCCSSILIVLAVASPTKASSSTGVPTPTPDRLAAPPTVASPNQADQGAQLYWLNCQPCHGDRAQGLTDEWRAQYPPEDQNCWNSGCHGKRSYEAGFTLPQQAPALIGPQTLTRFATAADLFMFIRQAMPYQAPGSLPPDEYWALTAYLLRAHGLPDSDLPIDSEAEARVIALYPGIRDGGVTALSRSKVAGSHLLLWIGLGAGVMFLAGLGLIAWRRRRSRV